VIYAATTPGTVGDIRPPTSSRARLDDYLAAGDTGARGGDEVADRLTAVVRYAPTGPGGSAMLYDDCGR
jgi:hypothetical protein